jgi:CHASE3 domain sensor protein
MILHRIRELETKLYQCDFYLVDYYSQLNVDELYKKKETLYKEREISQRLNKNLKNIDEVIEIVDLVMELKNLQDMYKAEGGETKGVIIG